MRDPVFKTQMFRFVDVLPALTSSGEVLKHMAEYLSSVKTPASGVLRGALAFGRLLPAMPAQSDPSKCAWRWRIFSSAAGTENLPFRTFAGSGEKALVSPWISWAKRSSATGKQTNSRPNMIDLLDFLTAGTRSWKVEGPLAAGEPPFVNVSVKISALCARVQASDPAGQYRDHHEAP